MRDCNLFFSTLRCVEDAFNLGFHVFDRSHSIY